MTPREPTRPDQPFAGARAQVPGAHSGSATSTDLTHPGREILPFDGSCSRVAGGWTIRVPVRAEHVSVSKQVVVYERVVVRRRQLEETAHVEAEARREELRVSTDGQIDVTEKRSDEVDRAPSR